MRNVVIILFIFAFTVCISAETQERKTPEQEAAGQAEKMQKELNLNTEQTEAVYRIQLKYAKQREASNSRSEALERVRNKDNDLKGVLRNDQYENLQNKKFDRSNSNSINTPQFRNSEPQRVSPQRSSEQPARISPQRSSEQPARTVKPQRSTEQTDRTNSLRNSDQPNRISIPQRSSEPARSVQPSRSSEQPVRTQPSATPTRRSPENQSTRTR